MHLSLMSLENLCEPLVVTSALVRLGHPVLLHSGMQVRNYGDYSFAACDPYMTLRTVGTSTEVRFAPDHPLVPETIRAEGSLARTGKPGPLAAEWTFEGNPFDLLDVVLAPRQMAPTDAPFGFRGGAIGHFGYDLGRHIEDLPCDTTDDVGAPDLSLGFYDSFFAFRHKTGEAWLCGVDPDSEANAENRAQELLKRVRSVALLSREIGPASDGRLRCNFTRDDYIKALERTIEYIRAGDIFQANLSQRFDADLRVSPWELFRRLVDTNPAPFAAYLGIDEAKVVSASPERFLKVVGRHVETRPIKGTRPRGSTAIGDEALAQELLSSEKDAAELTMIVDLERNDLGRVCRFGSVKTPELVVLESYPTVHHLVATVVGELLPGKTNVDLLRASFPGGSITGAPKIRAMEIIEELEPTRRGIYTGSIGYVGFDGTVDLNIVIRTVVVANGRAYFQVGGGIVADSDPENEYEETLDKGRALARALDAEFPQ